jgi:cell division protein FtsW
MSAALAMMFLGGVRLVQFLVLICLSLTAIAGLAISQPYRLQRLVTFLDPWAQENVFNSGYQLTQALIAFGRGEWFGVGIGNSVQKLFYLPEAHTDFVYAILAEETGLLGSILVIVLFFLLAWRIMHIARQAEKQTQFFSAYVSYGIAFLFSAQALINIGVNTGMLPTKGLTLPLLSYGGSSLIVCCISLAMVLRVDYETKRLLADGLAKKTVVTK